MEHRHGKITGLGNLELFWQAWLPEKAKAMVLLIHGFGEHSGRYDNVVQTLIPAGFGVWSNDHRGHGRSQGLLGHVNSFSDYVEDVHTFYRQVVAPEAAGMPLFVLGHSMGSIIAMNYVSRYSEPLAGCILSGTGSWSPNSGGMAIKTATALLSRIAPQVRVKFPLPPEFISRDSDVVQAYKDDPLVHNRISFRLAQGINAGLTSGVNGIQGVDLPILLQCGSADESFAGQQDLFDSLQTRDKTLKIYQGLKHEVYNELEPDRRVVLADLLAWLQGHIQ